MKRKRNLHDLAVRLCEGGCVDFFGHAIRAKVIKVEGNCCEMCDMDSICDINFADLCAECDGLSLQQHILYLA